MDGSRSVSARGKGPGQKRGSVLKGGNRTDGFNRKRTFVLDKKSPVKGKRRWRPPSEISFVGSQREGQGFAFWRKQKIQQEYKKLVRKQRKTSTTKEVLYNDRYPEHLKHLYLAEEEMLKKKEKQRISKDDAKSGKSEEDHETPSKKFKKMTSNQKAKEEYKNVQLKRAKKREEAEQNKKEREKAQQLYRQKRMESYKVLKAKTKKGQPNLNVQIDYLLEKIQQKS
ncbi:hypothetical protein GDO86_005648 [Hymenochirus boettgeri]|uniref:Thyroid transcription factor 1-associated protein 26 n=1 Tax=Hymenochirus boettgeri TaxID=247094 RepID=A0A8T2J2S1_9PIPI|nr:hypothetical protein GDO86_005648 [Hymenochirus boettgeri]